MIKSKIIEQTTSDLFGDTLTTYEIVVPKYLFTEINKHRMLGNCASSLRAIPPERLIESVQNDSFIPLYVGKKHKGMSASSYYKDKDLTKVLKHYNKAKQSALQEAIKLNSIRVSKQVINRILEPYTLSKMVITGTEWQNWFNLRGSIYEHDELNFDSWERLRQYDSSVEDLDLINRMEINKGTAEPHFKHLVELMTDQMGKHKPAKNKFHIPYLIESPELITQEHKMEYSASRVARTSYLTIDKDSAEDIQGNLKLAQLLKAEKHSVPFEFPQRQMDEKEYFSYSKSYFTQSISEDLEKDILLGKTQIIRKYSQGYLIIEFGWCKQYRGWIPYRHDLSI